MMHSGAGQPPPANEPGGEEPPTTYLVQDARYLMDDELNYELKARGIFKTTMRSMEKKTVLGEALEREKEQAIAMTESPYTIQADVGDCNNKITTISKFITSKNLASRAEARRLGPRLVHLQNKANRMHATNEDEQKSIQALNLATRNMIEAYLQVAAMLPTVEPAVIESDGPEDRAVGEALGGNASEVPPFQIQRAHINFEAVQNDLLASLELLRTNNGKQVQASNDDQAQAFAPADRVDPDELFGRHEPPPLPFSSTMHTAGRGRNSQPMPYGSMEQNRLSSIRQSEATQLSAYVRGEAPGYVNNRRPMYEPWQDANRNHGSSGMQHANMNNWGHQPSQRDRYDFENRDAANAGNRTFNIPFAPEDGNRPHGFSAARADQPKTIPIYRWAISFSGESKPKGNKDLPLNEFLYLVHVQKDAHRISDVTMLAQVHYLLTDKAKTWYFAYYDAFISWPNFVDGIRRRFLSEDYAFEAWNEIHKRVQQKDETALDYFSHMVMLYRSQPMALTEDMKLKIIRRGLLPEIRRVISPWNVETLRELEELVARLPTIKPVESKPSTRYSFARGNLSRKKIAVVEKESSASESEIEITQEEIKAIMKARDEKKRGKGRERKERKEPEPAKAADEVNKRKEDMKCHNCGEKGHFVRDCKKPLRGIFCFGCGKDDVTVKTCTCRTKNSV